MRPEILTASHDPATPAREPPIWPGLLMALLGALAASCDADARNSHTAAAQMPLPVEWRTLPGGLGIDRAPDLLSLQRAAPTGATRYGADSHRSPITAAVAQRLRSIYARRANRNDHVFMKVGDSTIVSRNFFRCFASSGRFGVRAPDQLLELRESLEFFRRGDAAGASPFDRRTVAGKVGYSAGWALHGHPSPLKRELAALNPRFAVIAFGTNDMDRGTTHETALWPFYESFSRLVDRVIAQGVIPIVTGIAPRRDTPEAAYWEPVYNGVIRGIAESRQVPYINLHFATKDLRGNGLWPDGIHGNVYRDDEGTKPCDFSAAGLEYHFNVRNLLTLEALDDVRRVVLDRDPAPDTPPEQLQGRGTTTHPFVIKSFPFTHSSSTSDAQRRYDRYPGCGSQDESGPERVYRFELQKQTTVRMFAFDGEGVDVDVHLLGASGQPDACLARHDRILERTLNPGRYHLVIDSHSPAGAKALSGDYLLVVVTSDPDDADELMAQQ